MQSAFGGLWTCISPYRKDDFIFYRYKVVCNLYNEDFWSSIETLVHNSEIIIDRPKGSVHPKYPDFVYNVDYGYLKNTSSMDGDGIDIWVGTEKNKKIDAIMCTVDLFKRDSEIKILIGCTDREKDIIYKTHNQISSMKGILILRYPKLN